METSITCAGDELEDFKEAKDWIKSHEIQTPLSGEDKVIFKFQYLHAVTTMELVHDLHICVQKLKKNKTLFLEVDMLRSRHQSRSQTEKNFLNLVKQFHNVIEHAVEGNNPYIGESHISATWMSPLHVLTWLLIPALPFQTTVYVETAKDSLYVFCLLEEIFKKDGHCFEFGYYDKSVASRSPYELRHGLAHMFVYEDADIQSAVSVIVEYLWNMKDHELCELTEVYIQESVHPKFVFLLTKKLAVKAQNHKWMKNCSEDSQLYSSYEDCIQSAMTAATSKGMEVYKPWEHAEIFTPTIILGNVQRKQTDIPLPLICIDSFRTIEEGILLSERSQNIQFASIWTESGPTAQYIAGQLKAGVVWVNTYGLFSPEVPFQLTTPQRDSAAAAAACVLGHKWISPTWDCLDTCDFFREWKSVCEKSDIKDTYKLAEQAHSKWGRANSSASRSEALLRMAYSISSNKEQYLRLPVDKDDLEACIKLLYSFAYKCKADSDSKTIDNMLSITTSRPLGVEVTMNTLVHFDAAKLHHPRTSLKAHKPSQTGVPARWGNWSHIMGFDRSAG